MPLPSDEVEPPVIKSHKVRIPKALVALTENTNTDNNGEKKKASSCGFDLTVIFWDTEYGVSIVSFPYFVLSLLTELPIAY